ncbi:CsbD family protein [Roseomonas indoligenes]|uniref:CsbD family protein n=1 Tax=Roseomonas indoligenes TaxID=2820811 RepID=UPI001FD775C4|nr:CsbD family protein [Pararoseomonas indoligenes]
MAIDKDRVEGSLKQAGGAIKENLGAAVGDKKMEAEGAAKRAEGKVQNAAGGVKDAVRDAADKA